MRNYLSVLKVFLIFFPIPALLKIYCNNDYFENVSLNSTCQRENEDLVNCRGSLYKVEKAYIECQPGYYNKQNVSIQVLSCTNDGEWSDEVIKCYPECIDSPDIRNVTLIDDKNTKFPEWYVELIRKESEKDAINRFPGVIISAKYILVQTKYVNFTEEFRLKFIARIYDTRRKFKDHDVGGVYKIRRNGFSIVHLNCYDYIKFNKDVKPVCPDSRFIASYENQLKVFIEHPVIHCRKCISDYDNPKAEVLCFQKSESFNYSVIECSEKSDFVLARCELGYQYVQYFREDRLSFCMSNIWIHQGNDCRLLCGKVNKIDEEIENGVRSFPWHVNIYAQSTEVPESIEYICSGTIIHFNVVISAVYCFYNKTTGKMNEASNYVIGAGQNYRNFEEIENYSFYSGVKEIYYHQKPHSKVILNEIAIVILEEYLKYSSYIRPACLDLTLYHQYGMERGLQGYIADWDPPSKESDFNYVLQNTKVTTLTNDQCKVIVDTNFRTKVADDKFCAISPNNLNACIGGGFLVKKDIGNGERYYLTGIITPTIDLNSTKIIQSCSDGFVTLFTNVHLICLRSEDLTLMTTNTASGTALMTA